MIRVRFHGRGGHGVKTASRVLGTAAFLAGRQVQDSPVYGAERRGAAIVAFTRIGEEPILERGVITQPDLVIVADETLFADKAAGVLAGQEGASALFVNTGAEEALAEYRIAVPVQCLNVTARTLEVLGRASALSAGLAAVAARMVGFISEADLVGALEEELAYLHLPTDVIEKNIVLSRDVFEAVSVVDFQAPAPPREQQLATIVADDLIVATPSILDPGNAVKRMTGTWRVERPVIDREVCTRCGLCVVRCPDGAVALDEDGYPVIDYDHCKGCMICNDICPIVAVDSEKETQAW